MPRAILTFNLPKEREEYLLANRAGDLSLIIWEFSQMLHEKVNYGDGKLVSWKTVKDEWWKILNEFKFDPYES